MEEWQNIGGGALSGKDLSKIDRSVAYMLRYIAKNIVKDNYVDRCEIGASYVIGDEKPIAVYLNTFGTNKIADEEILKKIKENYDLSVKSAKDLSSINNISQREELNIL